MIDKLKNWAEIAWSYINPDSYLDEDRDYDDYSQGSHPYGEEW